MRTRMYGGVGGEDRRLSPLSRSSAPCRLYRVQLALGVGGAQTPPLIRVDLRDQRLYSQKKRSPMSKPHDEPSAQIQLIPATPEQEPILANLLELYLHV